MGSNSYGWTFPASTIGGSGIKDATGIVRSNADTFTNAITKLDYWIYTNLIDLPPAPRYADRIGTQSNVGYYWSNPPQVKLGVLDRWVPHMPTIVLNLYSGVTSSSSNFYGRYVLGDPYVPNSTTPIQGVEFNNRITTGTMITYSNTFYKSHVLRIGVNDATATVENGPYSMVMNYSNFSINPVKTLDFGSINFQTLAARAPTLSDFTVARNNDGTLNVNIVPTTLSGTFLTPPPVYYYSISRTSGPSPIDIISSNPPGSFNTGQVLGVRPINCGFDQGFNFIIYASNSIGQSTPSNISANTGPAPFATTPNLGLSLSPNYTNGNITATYRVSGEDGTVHWRFTSPLAVPNGTGVVNTTFLFTPDGYFQYFDTNFTLRASNIRSCRQNSSVNTYTQSINYTVPTPSVSVTLSGTQPPYSISASLTTPSLPAGLTYSTAWQVVLGTVTNITTTNTNFSGTGTSTGLYRIGATFTYTDSRSRTRTSAQGQGNVSPGPVPFSFTGTINPNQQLAFTYPANALSAYAIAPTGYEYTNTPGPGVTITFRRVGSTSLPGTYEWGYSIQY